MIETIKHRNLGDAQNFNLNSLQRHFENQKKWPLVYTSKLLTIYIRKENKGHSLANQRMAFVIFIPISYRSTDSF